MEKKTSRGTNKRKDKAARNAKYAMRSGGLTIVRVLPKGTIFHWATKNSSLAISWMKYGVLYLLRHSIVNRHPFTVKWHFTLN